MFESLYNEIYSKILKQKCDYLAKELPFITPFQYIFIYDKSLLNVDIKIDDNLRIESLVRLGIPVIEDYDGNLAIDIKTLEGTIDSAVALGSAFLNGDKIDAQDLNIDINGDGIALAHHFSSVPFAYWFLEVTDAVLDREHSFAFYFCNLRATQHHEITSFTIDHIKLQPGLYVSRKGKVGAETVTTFDLRLMSISHPFSSSSCRQRKRLVYGSMMWRCVFCDFG